MKNTRASIRYAKAFLDLSLEQDNLSSSYTDMLSLKSICFESKDLNLFLNSPVVKTDVKLRTFNHIFSNNFSKLSMDFLNIIIKKKRENLMSGIAQSFINLYKTHNNIDTATITTAVPISEDLRQKIINYIKNQGNKQVELKEVVDENIVGGTIIRIGDKELDASVSTSISELRQTFNKNLYVQDF